MSRLRKLYQAMETLVSEGLELSHEQETQLRKAEEEIIQKEILPVLTEKIEPVLAQIERVLVLVVDYIPGEPLKVSLSRRRNLADVLKDAVEILPDPKVEHREFLKPRKKKDGIGPRKKLRVTFPDGFVIENNEACETLRLAIERIGIMRVRSLGLTANKVPLISNRRDEKYATSQHKLSNGWLLMTCTNTLTKKKQLDAISDGLNLRIKTEIIN